MSSLHTFRFRLTLATCAFFLVYKLYALHGHPVSLLLSTWSFEACVALWIFALTALLGRVRVLARVHLPEVLFALLFAAHFTLWFFTVKFFDDALVRKYSLLDLGPDAVAYLVKSAPPGAATSCAGALGGLCVLALLTRRVRVPGRAAVLGGALIALSAVVLIVAGRSTQLPTPLWHLALDLEEIRHYPSLTPSPQHPPRARLEHLDKASAQPVKLQTRFTRVLVFVMEAVTLQHFLESRAKAPAENFFRRTEAAQHFYSSVFANDMDSRTGLLALLTSRFVPFEAYTDPAIERYRHLAQKRSLVDLMRDNGYFSAIGAAQVVEEGIVKQLSWDDRLVMTEAETQASRDRYLCFRPYRFEDSCEDQVLLPRLFELIDQKPRLFWVQQLVWGHIPDYSRTTQKTDVQYYGELLDAVTRHLEAQGLLDETLIVVTSDHGVREPGTEKLPSTYRIPLLFYARSFEHRENTDLHSQIDLKDILVATLDGTEGELRGADFAMFMGPTHSAVFGAVTRDRDFMVLKNRPLAKYVLTFTNIADESRPPSPPVGPDTPGELLTLLNDYRDYFQSTELR